MGVMKKVADLFSPNDPELVEKTLARLSEQDTWNDVFSTKLIEILDKIDGIKAEIRQRLREADDRIRTAESVTKAESFLLKEAAKAEQLKNTLSAVNRASESLRSELLTAKKQYQGAETLRSEAEKILVQAQEEFTASQARRKEAIERHRSAAELAYGAAEEYRKSSGEMKSATQSYREATASLETAKAKEELAGGHFARAATAEQRATKNALDAAAKLEESSALLDEATQLALGAKALGMEAKGRFQLARDSEVSASRLARLTTRYASSAVALSWIAMLWTAWLMVHTRPVFWAALTLSTVLVAAGVFVLKGGRGEVRAS
jgi:DNA repair exonuclease SbcCD ATPase subunit